MSKSITVLINRHNPFNSESSPGKYTVHTDDPMTAQALLRYIYRHLDPTLAFRDYNCFAGICSGCQLRINGKEALACNTLVDPGATITLEPSRKGNPIRDLVITFNK